MIKKTTLIFDFDGTIADTLDHIYKILNLIAKEANIKKFSKEEFDQTRDKHPLSIIKQFKIPVWKIPFLVKKGQKMLYKYIDKIKLIKGMKEALIKLDEKGYRLGILTSNSKENIDRFLLINNLNVFDFIYCGSNLFGKSGPLKKILKKYNLKKEEVYYIGDEIRDIEACQKVGVDVIAVSWGFNTRKILEKYQPMIIIDRPEKLMQFLLQLIN